VLLAVAVAVLVTLMPEGLEVVPCRWWWKATTGQWSVGFGGGYGGAQFFVSPVNKTADGTAGGSGNGSAYGDAIGSAGEILGEGNAVTEGDGGGYANGGGGGFIAEDGIEPYVYQVGTFFPDVPASPIFFSP
jgi:hypothetical protein